MLPVTLLSAYFSFTQYQNERARLVFKYATAGRLLADAVDEELRTVEVVLQALASSPALGSRDFDAFRVQALDVIKRGYSESIVLVDGTGQQLMNTSAPPSKPLPRIPDEALVKTLANVLASGKTAVSGLFLGPVQKKPLAMVTVPILNPVVAVPAGMRADAPSAPFVLAGVKLPSKVQALLVKQQLPAGWTVTVVDAAGAIVARSSDISTMLGQPASRDVLRLVDKRVDVVEEGLSRADAPSLLIVTRSRYSDWSVAIGVPLKDMNQELRAPFWWVLGLTISIVLLSLALAWIIGGRMARTVSTLRGSAAELGAGSPVLVPSLSFREANEVGDAIRRASLTIQSTGASLRESELRMRSILEMVPDAIIAVDENFHIVLFNPSATRMFGWTEERVIGMHFTALMPERFRPVPSPKSGDASLTMKDLKPIASMSHGLHQSGKEFPVEVSYATGKTLGLTRHTLVIRDITIRMRDYEALERSNHDLQQFAYVASHDLKTPLRSISGFIQLLERKYAHSFEKGAQALIDRTQAATRRLEQLTDDLLAYARINSDMAPFVMVDLHGVATEVTQLLDAAIHEAGARVVIDKLPTVRGARSQLVQLVLNLLGNALKYRCSGPSEIRISAARQGSDWVISVADNGIGIEPQHYERIFEVFKRLHGQSEYAGTGIGLAVCRRVVHQHGGKIWVRSVPGQGSTFQFTIPAVHQEGARP
jgi:PAS domain S-box-containing protein